MQIRDVAVSHFEARGDLSPAPPPRSVGGISMRSPFTAKLCTTICHYLVFLARISRTSGYKALWAVAAKILDFLLSIPYHYHPESSRIFIRNIIYNLMISHKKSFSRGDAETLRKSCSERLFHLPVFAFEALRLRVSARDIAVLGCGYAALCPPRALR
jgi:hypothetical protein